MTKVHVRSYIVEKTKLRFFSVFFFLIKNDEISFGKGTAGVLFYSKSKNKV